MNRITRSLSLIAFIAGLSAIVAVIACDAHLLYFHICAAITCYACFITCVVFNIGIHCGKSWQLTNPIAACEAGLILSFITITTGIFWANQAWGVPWVWEPRLTGAFLMTLIFLSWRIAVLILGTQIVSNKKMTASLVTLGLPAIFFTHVAVRFFGGIHPSSIPPSTLNPTPGLFILTGFGYISTAFGFICLRARQLASRIEQKAK